MRYLFFINYYLVIIQNGCWGLFWFNADKTRTPLTFVIETYDPFFFKTITIFLFIFFHFFYYRVRFTTITPIGATTKPLTFLEGRLGLTTMKRSFPPTGTHPSPRSASVWRSTTRSGLLSSTSRRTPCTLWSLMGNTAAPHWVVTRGSRWLVQRPPYSSTVTRKVSTLFVVIFAVPKQESVSLVTTKTIAPIVTLELDLVLEDILIMKIHVETRLEVNQIMVKNLLRRWDLFWCSKKKLIWVNSVFHVCIVQQQVHEFRKRHKYRIYSNKRPTSNYRPPRISAHPKGRKS